MNNFINECISAPRINGMAEFFSSTASGEKHKPFRLVEIDDRLFHSYDYIKFAKHLTKNSGPFVNHYFQYTIQQGRRVQIRNNSNKIRNHAKQKIKHMVSWYG